MKKLSRKQLEKLTAMQSGSFEMLQGQIMERDAEIERLNGQVIDANDSHEEQLVKIYEALGGDLEWVDPSGVFNLILDTIEEMWRTQLKTKVIHE